ncbi:hypothetical protein BFZC1_23788 [Lysinibacillus fusiformis ZC1]|nr:hypothetical protein BFZC1_23788 [Lysinibacillus fusiformis ZC1]EKU41542.1 hypothetical protein C518_3472 [Lysinibacillus fusiformis ZB2]
MCQPWFKRRPLIQKYGEFHFQLDDCQTVQEILFFIEDRALEFPKESTLWNKLPSAENNKVTSLGSTTSYFNDPVSLKNSLI